jgi:hypothetical protein
MRLNPNLLELTEDDGLLLSDRIEQDRLAELRSRVFLDRKLREKQVVKRGVSTAPPRVDRAGSEWHI